MPLGALSLSAYLKNIAAVETRLIDFNIILNRLERFEFHSFGDFFRNFFSLPQESNYDPCIIGISALFTPSYQNVLDIAQCCREVFPDAIITAGGGVPTNMYNQIFKDSECFDALCYGEGEKPLLGLVKADDKLRYLEGDPSWITPRKADNKKAFLNNLIDNLDEIPFYDYGICEVNEYGLNPAITAYASIGEKNKNFHVMTSRGCIFHCSFCSSYTVHGRKMRYHSVNRVKEDLTRLKGEYGARTIVFQDDHFMADKQRALEIIDIIKGLRMTAVFQNGLALYALDREMLEALKSAGVNQLLLSIESGSDRVLKEIMHKPFDISAAKRVADDCRELGIYTNVNILIGLPGETKQDIEDTRSFLKTINANWFLIFCATPLVGSEMFNICVRKKYLKGNYIDCDYKKAVVETEDFTAEYIQETAYALNLELNFTENSDFKLGNYAVALKGFENAIRAKSDHAVAYYYAAKCHEKLGNTEKARQYLETAEAIAAKNKFWRKYLGRA
jgi:radical SAM superfamily enzyme YgiQ (UPF0313 family)